MPRPAHVSTRKTKSRHPPRLLRNDACVPEDPAQGVVDGNCRVHGTANLYVGGSSVFASTGHANPTFTIVQLALRLGDHLDGELHA